MPVGKENILPIDTVDKLLRAVISNSLPKRNRNLAFLLGQYFQPQRAHEAAKNLINEQHELKFE